MTRRWRPSTRRRRRCKSSRPAWRRAQINLNHCTITSPVNGIVISRSVDVGETVAASLNAPVLFTVANDLAKMQIDASVAEGDVGELVNGQTVNFTVDAYPYRTFHGMVAQVRNSPVTVQNVVTYDTVVSVNNDDLKLKPGMTANLSIVIAQRPNVLRIPNAALRFRPAGESRQAGAVVPGTPPPGPQATPKPRVKHDATHTIYVLPDGAAKPAAGTGASRHQRRHLHRGRSTDCTTATWSWTASSPTIPAMPGQQGGGSVGMRRPF